MIRYAGFDPAERPPRGWHIKHKAAPRRRKSTPERRDRQRRAYARVLAELRAMR